MSMGADRRSARPYDVLLRAFLQARGWRGGRRALLDALPDGGRIEGPRSLFDVLGRIGYRCTWRIAFAARVPPSVLPALAIGLRGPVLLTHRNGAGDLVGIGPDDPRTERILHPATPLLVAAIAGETGERRSPANGILAGEAPALAAIALLSIAPFAFGLGAPALARDLTGGAPVAFAMLAGVAAVALAARIARANLLSGMVARIETRLTALAAERALFAPPDAHVHRPDRFGAFGRLVSGGALEAAIDVIVAVGACIGALMIGGAAAVAPVFAMLALALAFQASRPRSREIAAADFDDDERAFRRADRTSGLVATGRALVALSAAALLALWAADHASFADLVGLALALRLASGPLLALLAADEDLVDAEIALTHVRALDAMQTEPAGLRRITVRAPAPVDFVDVYVPGVESGEGAMRAAGLRIEPGEVMTFLGSRGSGAHTALSALCGLTPIDQGRILVGGRDVAKTDAPAFRAEIAYAAPDLVFPSMPAFDLVRRLAPFADEEAARGAFERCLPASTGIGPDDIVTAAAPAALRLRLALAGALARRAPLIAIALDDADVAPDLLELLADQTRALRRRATIILAGRDPALLPLADRAAVFDRGRITALGPADLVLVTPESPAPRFAFARLA